MVLYKINIYSQNKRAKGRGNKPWAFHKYFPISWPYLFGGSSFGPTPSSPSPLLRTPASSPRTILPSTVHSECPQEARNPFRTGWQVKGPADGTCFSILSSASTPAFSRGSGTQTCTACSLGPALPHSIPHHLLCPPLPSRPHRFYLEIRLQGHWGRGLIRDHREAAGLARSPDPGRQCGGHVNCHRYIQGTFVKDPLWRRK